jgi:hypothetical protein
MNSIFPEPKSTAADWEPRSDLDGKRISVHKPTGGSVKAAGGWRYRTGTGEWSEVVENLGIAMDRAMGEEDGFEILG